VNSFLRRLFKGVHRFRFGDKMEERRGQFERLFVRPRVGRVHDVNLDTPVTELDWIPMARRRVLERIGIQSFGGLLTHYPRRYEDRTRFERFPSEEGPGPVCVCGVIRKIQIRRVRGGQKMLDAVLEEENAHALSPRLVLRWFNAHWVERMLAEGVRVVVYGRLKRSGSNLVLAHPEFEVLDEEPGLGVHHGRITPVHPATEGLNPKAVRGLIWDGLQRLHAAHVPNRLPVELTGISRWEALRQIHFPDTWETLAEARRHLVLEEFLGMQLRVVSRREDGRRLAGGRHCGTGEWMGRLHKNLPFELTGAQHRAIEEIRVDLAAPQPMNRLLHGDVGSGKTLVALSAMLLVVEAGFSAALMAPTQILAEQHYLQFKRLLEPLGVGVALRTGNRREETGPLPLFSGGVDGPQIYVGTHALLYEPAGLGRLGLVVIDEQHKFGVLQRARLRDQGSEHDGGPDVLVMTATPIPRTLTMTVYGDLEVSVLDELPANRGRVVTGVRPASKLPEAVSFLREQLGQGRQVYIVYPLIEESEKLEAKAATAEFERWKKLLDSWQCELLHGRVGAEEKEAIMGRFRSGNTQVLVATTVIEVGIDVPNATVMLIENAERFGLAQLHQLRGRIGRGSHKGYCVLLCSEGVEGPALEKLQVLAQTQNGFEIAEADLRLRGPGDLLGTAQSGAAPLKLGCILGDADLMGIARREAERILAADPGLELSENRGLRGFLEGSGEAVLAGVS
jgi:ATP-dependent DNA helicase RecG